MSMSVFTKHWDDKHGFTIQEAVEEKWKVDEAHGVGTRESKWREAVIAPDLEKLDGYMVIIQPM